MCSACVWIYKYIGEKVHTQHSSSWWFSFFVAFEVCELQILSIYLKSKHKFVFCARHHLHTQFILLMLNIPFAGSHRPRFFFASQLRQQHHVIGHLFGLIYIYCSVRILINRAHHKKINQIQLKNHHSAIVFIIFDEKWRKPANSRDFPAMLCQRITICIWSPICSNALLPENRPSISR